MLDVDWPNDFHAVVFTDADNFEPEEPIKKAAGQDKWEGEDEEEDVKVNYITDARCCPSCCLNQAPVVYEL